MAAPELGARVMRGPLGREDRLADGPWIIARDMRDQRGTWVLALDGDPRVTVSAYPQQLVGVAGVNPQLTGDELATPVPTGWRP